MLVLSRKKDETIIINDNIRVMVVEIRGDKVRLGIQAPPNIRIDREEIHQKRNRATTGSESDSQDKAAGSGESGPISKSGGSVSTRPAMSV